MFLSTASAAPAAAPVMTWPAAITLCIALLGAVLGIINTWNSVSQRRVKLRVSPAWAVGPFGGAFGIEVTNLSAFALTISEVGFLHNRPVSSTPARIVVSDPVVTDGKPYPRRLEPREQVTVYFDPRTIPPGKRLWRAYAKTACGELKHGGSPALDQLEGMVSGGS
ncbi:hypothetical protein [Altericroceibacterium xinjiangense]|uniref:hypothetical protein n=1 Tax=Altericroceibacterium xinjiangense TaxID=762261 RepID=UPI000F7F35AE|nr:hypothetical protein [Altericroceibacterium xinjiangense]